MRNFVVIRLPYILLRVLALLLSLATNHSFSNYKTIIYFNVHLILQIAFLILWNCSGIIVVRYVVMLTLRFVIPVQYQLEQTHKQETMVIKYSMSMFTLANRQRKGSKLHPKVNLLLNFKWNILQFTINSFAERNIQKKIIMHCSRWRKENNDN